MTTSREMQSFRILWWTLGIGILVMSVQTVLSARGMHSHDEIHAALIGTLEAISAILFLIPKTMRIGAVGLLLTIFIAFAIHTLMHHFRWDLLIYAAAVFYVRARGVL
jgi:uncharacterized membrane protein YphA (DoxX/SURF4 family)